MIRKLPFLHRFLNKNTQESGRSMVEILGVLAVMGVLSAGGIYGYSFAMDKYRANDIVYEVNLRAHDIWHKYQEMPLPEPSEDGTDFNEFPDITGTGYPIYMTSHPDVAFKTYVEGVSSRVCKNVVNMNLNGVVKGIQFVQVAQGDGDLIKYTGSASICGEDETDNTIVFTSFLDSETTDNNQYCVEDIDCPQECGEAICDENTMTCQNSCTGTNKPICLVESNTCVECITNNDCKSKGKGYICDESSYTCSALQKTCPAGTFRTKNGACLACNNGHNFVVLKDEIFPDTSDEVDGYTMCQNCGSDDAGDKKYNRSYGELEEGKAFCDYMCRTGYTYQSTNGCVSCTDEQLHYIPNEEQAKSQCLACSNNHAWYKTNNDFWCQPTQLVCKDDEFMKFGWPNKCIPCSDYRNEGLQINSNSASSTHNNFVQFLQEKCNSCPDSSPRYATQITCYPVCEQPENEEESIAICKANPLSENCKRKWQNWRGNCFNCDEITTNNQISGGDIAKLSELCQACGRTVEGQYCVLKTQNCETGQFLGSDGFCYDCDESDSIDITSLEDSGCVTNCKKTSSDATDYSKDGTIETRWGYTQDNGKLLCVPVCPENHSFAFSDRKCQPCGDSTTTFVWETETGLIDKCEEDCPNREIYRTWRTFCSPKICPNTQTQKYYKNRKGECVLCSRNNNDDDNQDGTDGLTKGIELCHTCGNRMMVQDDSTYCRKVDISDNKIPISGICNNIGNEYYNDANLNSDLKAKADYFVSGAYLTQSSKRYFRSTDGYCRDCETITSYKTTQSQCRSCANRRWSSSSGMCVKGLCDNGFFLSEGSCILCSNINKPIDPNYENLCSDCDNRRPMEIGTPETTWSGLCVEECAGMQWQDINGNCLSCSEGGERQIGTDAESRRLCNECDNLRKIQPIYNGNDETQIIGYKCVFK